MSLIYGQGKVIAGRFGPALATGMRILVADPHSPWQHGANENTNGLRNHYFPKGTWRPEFDQTDFDTAAEDLNARPRESLDHATPEDQLNIPLAGLVRSHDRH
jgi:IS30 family transposase